MKTTPSHIWFCRKCRRKGDLDDDDEFERTLAVEEHRTSSPGCKGLIRIATIAESEKDPSIRDYQDWAN